MLAVAVAVKVVLEALEVLEVLEELEVLVATHNLVAIQDTGLLVMDVTTIVA